MQDKKILLIHCGGTLGMVTSNNGFKTERGFLARFIKQNKMLNDEAYIEDSVLNIPCLSCRQQEEIRKTSLINEINIEEMNLNNKNDEIIIEENSIHDNGQYLVERYHESQNINECNCKDNKYVNKEDKNCQIALEVDKKDSEKGFTSVLTNIIYENVLSNNLCECNNYIYVTPQTKQGHRIFYEMIELNTIIDSSNATLDDWFGLLRILEELYKKYDGFVLIHGTDTMAYATSFFSHMISGLNKPIVFTGSMQPIQKVKREGEVNIWNSLIVASSTIKPDVYLQVYKNLHKGNKVTKMSSYKEDAFWSARPLIFKEYITLYYIKSHLQPIFNAKIEKRIGVLKVYPNISCEILKVYLETNKGIVLETFGCGNAFSNRSDIIELMEKYINSGVIVINISQCLDGQVNDYYEANNELSRIGVINGKSMTTESAFCKLASVLGNYKFKNHNIIKNDFYKLFFD